ncbi:MAG: hypothetical protein J5902_05645 [Paludibacteraceae bacterium]|nr:hypothetical protein [Paludibacteraceae bacterium]
MASENSVFDFPKRGHFQTALFFAALALAGSTASHTLHLDLAAVSASPLDKRSVSDLPDFLEKKYPPTCTTQKKVVPLQAQKDIKEAQPKSGFRF